jgi:uncharacterized membrane protein YjgN (DUF898 family)
MYQLRKLDLSKKGSIVDIGFLLVALFGLAFFILIVAFVFPQITAKLKLSDLGNNNDSLQALETTDGIMNKLDMVFLTIFSGLIMAVLITSFFLDSHPIFIPIYVIALGLLVLFAVIAENIYESFSISDQLSSTTVRYPFVNSIMLNLVYVAIGTGILSMILIFAKRGFTATAAY